MFHLHEATAGNERIGTVEVELEFASSEIDRLKIKLASVDEEQEEARKISSGSIAALTAELHSINADLIGSKNEMQLLRHAEETALEKIKLLEPRELELIFHGSVVEQHYATEVQEMQEENASNERMRQQDEVEGINVLEEVATQNVASENGVNRTEAENQRCNTHEKLITEATLDIARGLRVSHAEGAGRCWRSGFGSGQRMVSRDRRGSI